MWIILKRLEGYPKDQKKAFFSCFFLKKRPRRVARRSPFSLLPRVLPRRLSSVLDLLAAGAALLSNKNNKLSSAFSLQRIIRHLLLHQLLSWLTALVCFEYSKVFLRNSQASHKKAL